MTSRAVTQDWRLLADAVIKRRTDLGMTQQDVQAAGGPGTATLRNIEGAHQMSYRGVILGRLERVLRWEPGSIDAILAGGDPTPIKTNPTPALRPPRPQPGTLAEVLIERGLRTPHELMPSDYVVDPLVQELLASESFPDDFKDRWLVSYSVMRRELHEATRQAKEKPRDR
jgi:hypothetical protein